MSGVRVFGVLNIRCAFNLYAVQPTGERRSQANCLDCISGGTAYLRAQLRDPGANYVNRDVNVQFQIRIYLRVRFRQPSRVNRAYKPVATSRHRIVRITGDPTLPIVA
jgi:hypothetical protein